MYYNNMMHFIFLYLFLILSFMSPINGGTIDPSTPDSKHIAYGVDYYCVLPLIGFYNSEDLTPFRASCVVIDEHHFLTAAHVVENTSIQCVIFDNKPFICKKVVTHPQFKHGQHGFFDIAIGTLDKSIKLNAYPILYTDNNENGKVCGIAGYGSTGTFDTGYIRYDGKKRGGSNIIKSIEKHLLIVTLDDKKTELEFLIAPGDSGGGLFIDQKLAGINSCVYALDGKTDSNYGDVGGHTRISLFTNWINNNIKKAYNDK